MTTSPLFTEEDINPPEPTVCLVPGCPDPPKTRGFCRRHYDMRRKDIEPLAALDRRRKPV